MGYEYQAFHCCFQVKSVYVGHGRPDVFNEFMEMMNSFTLKKISNAEVVSSVCRLFEGDTDLIMVNSHYCCLLFCSTTSICNAALKSFVFFSFSQGFQHVFARGCKDRYSEDAGIWYYEA